MVSLKWVGPSGQLTLTILELSPWLPRKTKTLHKSPQSNQRIPMKPLRLEDVVVLDDDDDDIEIRKTGGLKPECKRRIKSYTSTPADKGRNNVTNRNGFQNGHDDILLMHSTKSPKEKQLEAKLAGFEYLKPKSAGDKPLFSIGKLSFTSFYLFITLLNHILFSSRGRQSKWSQNQRQIQVFQIVIERTRLLSYGLFFQIGG